MRRFAAWLSLALGQMADLMATATATSRGATEANPFFHSPEAWLIAKLTYVTLAAVILALPYGSTRLTRTALWLGLLGATTATWNLMQSFGG